MVRYVVLLLAFIAFVSSEPVRIVPPTKGPTVYVSPEEAPNQFIMEDNSQVEGLAQATDVPTTPYYTGPAQHQKKGTPGAAIAANNAAFMEENESQTQTQKQTTVEVVPTQRADIIPGFDSSDPVIVPAKTTDEDVIALEKQATIEEENLRELKAKIVQKKQENAVEKQMKFREKLTNLEKQKDLAIQKIKEQAAEQERIVLEQEAEEASKIAQEQSLSTEEKNEAEKKREASPLPLISKESNPTSPVLFEKSSDVQATKAIRMRQVIQSKKEEKKKDEDEVTDEQEALREARAATQLRNSIVASLQEDADEMEGKAHQEADLAHTELDRAPNEEHGWSFLRTATRHIQDAAKYLQRKEDAVALQDIVTHAQDAAAPAAPIENLETTVALADPDSVIDDSSFIQVNHNVMKAVGVKPARALMNQIKQMRKNSM